MQWAEAFLAQHGFETPYSMAPALCVEILSPSNSAREREEKRRSYFAGGAWEVWLVGEDGAVQVFGAEGRRPASQFGIPLDGIG